jgi:hypothetical protein
MRLEKHPELRDVADGVSLKQGMHVQVGIPFLDRMHLNLQQRARALVERPLTLSVFSTTEHRRIGIKAVVEAKSPACRVGTDAGLV